MSNHFFPAGIYLVKVNNRNPSARCEIYSKLTIKTTDWRHWQHSDIFIVNFEHVTADWVLARYFRNVFFIKTVFFSGIFIKKLTHTGSMFGLSWHWKKYSRKVEHFMLWFQDLSRHCYHGVTLFKVIDLILICWKA